MKKRYGPFYGLIFSLFLAANLLAAIGPLSAQEEEAAAPESGGQSIRDYLEQALPSNPGRRIVLDETTGMLTVTDTPSNQQVVKELIKLWDVGTKQVRIQARFVEVDVTALSEIGVEWWWRRTQDTVHKRDLGINAVTPPVEDIGTTGTRSFGTATETSGLGIEVGKSFLTGSRLFVYIKALEEQGKANLLSSPSVTTLSGQMANIQLANILPYASEFERTNIGTAGAPVMVEKYKVTEKVSGITLEVTPKVAGEGKIITMDIHPEVTVINRQIPISTSADFPANLGYPLIDTRSTQTSVVIKSGQTVVLGGLIREDETITERKTPFLGDIPILGYLFKTKHVEKQKKNLVIFLTATIIDSRGEPII
jgi:type II secretory pathway component GspD/PulD (secretin)